MLNTSPQIRFLIVSIVPHTLSEYETFRDVKELISLVESFGGIIADIVLQNRETHDKGLYIGRGKIEEIANILVEKDIDVVVLNSIIKAGQVYELQSLFEKFKLGIQVWDRVDLILKIFASHANTSEAKLQIELAAMRHMGPRIYGMGEEMSRQGGMVGTRGIGETNTERMKRHWREQMKKVRDDLVKLITKKKAQLDQRSKTGLKTVSLVGYTNAGKTSLFNKLTGKKRLVQDALFVTLDSTIGKFYLKMTRQEVLVSDTIGFIKNLPPELIEAFKSTLMESVYADLLVHVIDLSDQDMDLKIYIVEQILKSLSIDNKKCIYVFNKIDQTTGKDLKVIKKKYQNFNPQFISTKTGIGIDELENQIGELISQDTIKVEDALS